MIESIVKGRRVFIFGIGKQQEDFEYVYDDISVEGYMTVSGEESFNGNRAFKFSELSNDFFVNTLVIICLKKDETVEKLFTDKGLYGNGKNYIWAEELFVFLDFNLKNVAASRSIVAIGEREAKNIDKIENEFNINIEKYIESDAEEVCFSESDKKNNYYIIVSADYEKYYKLLISQGLEEQKDFISFKQLMFEMGNQKPSAMMKTTYYAPSTHQKDCTRPFTHAFLMRGKMYCCCISRVNKQYGDFFTMSPDIVWNSNIAKVFRLSVINHTYCFCNPDRCFLLKPNPPLAENERIVPIPKVEKSPALIQVAIDHACNLHCLSCRKEVYIDSEQESKNIEFVADRLIKSGWIDDSKELWLAGDGEVFFSKSYRKLLYESISGKREDIHILSNGILFNEKEFEKIKAIYKRISVSISVDSLEKDMYEKLRTGGKYEIIKKNLEMLGDKRAKGELDKFEVFVVVQMDNLYELPTFIKRCIDMNVDTVLLNPIHKGGVYDDASFIKASVQNPDGSLKQEVVEVFSDPIFKSSHVSSGWFINRLPKSKEDNCYINS